MNTYLEDTEYASKIIIEAIFHEQSRISEINSALKAFDILHWDYSSSDLNDDFSPGYVIDRFNRMAKFHQENKIPEKRAEKERLEIEIANKKSSLNSLSMSLLQIAKQGISIIHGGLDNCPDGRYFNDESLKNVIWQARNQSIHYEEGNYRSQVLQCFNNLENDYGEIFHLEVGLVENKAKLILDLLEWKKYENYIQDMNLLLPA